MSNCLMVGQQTQGPVDTGWTFTDCSDGEKWLYAKVFVGDTSVTAEWSIILDATKPVLNDLTLFDLSSLDQGFTDDRLVGVDYQAVELPFNELQYLILSEDVGFAMPDTITEYPTPAERYFMLSPDFERKTVYGYLVDRAENVSADTLSASIMLFEHTHNYPNPFNPDNEPTNLVFTLAKNEKVTILIYDLFGNLVFEKEAAGAEGLNDGANDAALQWDGRNMQGVAVAGGGYICVIKAGDREISKHKIAVIR